MAERLKTFRRVVVASCVVKKRIKSVGHVVAAGCIAQERINTVGRVVAAPCVVKERLKTVGRVVVAGCVVKERTHTVGRVVIAGGVAKERVNTEPDQDVYWGSESTWLGGDIRYALQFKLRAHFLQAGSEHFDLLLLLRKLALKVLLLLRHSRSQFLDLAALFEELVEQHRVDRIVAHGADFTL